MNTDITSGQTGRRRLLFFAAADTRTNPGPAWSAYHFAEVAAGAGLVAEVRLAGSAVLLAQSDGVEESASGRDLLRLIASGRDAAYDISMCPGCIAKHDITEDEIAGIGAVPRDLADILTEVAEGRTEMIHVG